MDASKRRMLALLGDSILDNAPYTNRAPDTTTHLKGLMGPGWAIERAATDGATMDGVASQVAALPPGRPDVVVLSVGGNDLMGHVGILTPRQTTTTEFLATLQDIAEDFAAQYGEVLAFLRPATERLIVCTIYEVPLTDRRTARLALPPLAMVNDRIVRAARRVGAEVLELRDVCTEASDFVMQIEPSAQGARKIAQAIATAVKG